MQVMNMARRPVRRRWLVQNLEAVPGVLSAEGNPQVGFPLENGESSIAQVAFATLGYSKMIGQPLPHGAQLTCLPA